ncbi:hypothetical protein PGQ11_009952 [Apiospora arundinis]|uniref:Uncharacterized protein n=1 Tax=Apiospora arundinis TaxID=335852 RepID=A0ABR2I853_9PEZI
MVKSVRGSVHPLHPALAKHDDTMKLPKEGRGPEGQLEDSTDEAAPPPVRDNGTDPKALRSRRKSGIFTMSALGILRDRSKSSFHFVLSINTNLQLLRFKRIMAPLNADTDKSRCPRLGMDPSKDYRARCSPHPIDNAHC